MCSVQGIIQEILKFRDVYDVSARELASLCGLSPHTVINVLVYRQGRIESLEILHETAKAAMARIEQERAERTQQAASTAPLAGLARS